MIDFKNYLGLSIAPSDVTARRPHTTPRVQFITKLQNNHAN